MSTLRPTSSTALEQACLMAALLVGLLLRLKTALGAPWYWDEGYVAEMAQALGRGQRPSLGGLWQDGFFPLGTPWLAPLSAAPWTMVPWWSAMTGVRLWAVLLDAGAAVMLYAAGSRLAGKRFGMLACAAFALLPFASAFGGRAFYHHFSVLTLVAALWLGTQALDDPAARGLKRASFFAGLTLATCYWSWWLPLSWCAVLVWTKPRHLVPALLWMAVPVLVLGASNFWPDPAAAWWSLNNMRELSSHNPASVMTTVQSLVKDLAALPWLLVGAAGLALAAWREPRRWAWILACLVLATVEPIRQRGSIQAMPYPFILAVPLAALGWAVLASEALLRPLSWRLALVLPLALFFKPVDVAWIEQWSFQASKVAELSQYLKSHAAPGDSVCGLPNFNWALKPELRVCEPFTIGAAEGRPSGYYFSAPPLSKLAGACRLEDLRYMVSNRVYFLGAFHYEGVALSFLEVERQGWPMVFDDGAFKVFENPRFGARAKRGVSILQSKDNYLLAAAQAHRVGRADAEAYALAAAQAR